MLNIIGIIIAFSFCASIFLLVGVAFLNSKYRELERKVEYHEADIYMLKNKISKIESNTSMIDNIPINEILFDLISVCGYRLENHYAPKFKLNKKEDK
jgi:hypothetical protein